MQTPHGTPHFHSLSYHVHLHMKTVIVHHAPMASPWPHRLPHALKLMALFAYHPNHCRQRAGSMWEFKYPALPAYLKLAVPWLQQQAATNSTTLSTLLSLQAISSTEPLVVEQYRLSLLLLDEPPTGPQPTTGSSAHEQDAQPSLSNDPVMQQILTTLVLDESTGFLRLGHPPGGLSLAAAHHIAGMLVGSGTLADTPFSGVCKVGGELSDLQLVLNEVQNITTSQRASSAHMPSQTTAVLAGSDQVSVSAGSSGTAATAAAACAAPDDTQPPSQWSVSMQQNLLALERSTTPSIEAGSSDVLVDQGTDGHVQVRIAALLPIVAARCRAFVCCLKDTVLCGSTCRAHVQHVSRAFPPYGSTSDGRNSFLLHANS